MRYTTVLLDIDGTLVDSNDAHAHAWVNALRQHDRPAPFERVRRLIGMGGDKLLRELADLDSESGEGQAIASLRGKIFQEQYLPRLRPTTGARPMVEWMKRHHLAIGIATSATAVEVQGLLRAAGVADLIDYTTTSDDAEESKPDPDIVVAALERSRASADASIMIGDTPYDIEAARRAGVDVIAFRSGGWRDADLRGALAVFDHPADLLEHVDSSPLAP